MLQVPSVTMKGGRRSRVTRMPLIAAAEHADQQAAAAKAIGTGTPMMDGEACPSPPSDRTMMAPTDRSMPAVRMIRVCAIADDADDRDLLQDQREVEGVQEFPAGDEREQG